MFVARWIDCWCVLTPGLGGMAVKDKPPCHAGYDASPKGSPDTKMPSADNVQTVLDPHVRSVIICIVAGLVGFGVGWLVDQIHKDMKN
jgi:hypothetical protein